MDKNFADILASHEQLSSLCKKLNVVFSVVFYAFCAAVAMVLLYIIFLPSGFSSVGLSSLLPAVPALLSVFSGGFILYLIKQIVRDIGKGNSPFSVKHIRQIRLLGVVFLVIMVCNLFIAPSQNVGVQNGDAQMFLYSGSNNAGSMKIDMSSFISAVVCFVLSVVFKYGSTLENETSDLI